MKDGPEKNSFQASGIVVDHQREAMPENADGKFAGQASEDGLAEDTFIAFKPGPGDQSESQAKREEGR